MDALRHARLPQLQPTRQQRPRAPRRRGYAGRGAQAAPRYRSTQAAPRAKGGCTPCLGSGPRQVRVVHAWGLNGSVRDAANAGNDGDGGDKDVDHASPTSRS